MSALLRSPSDEALDNPSRHFNDEDFARAALIYADLRDEAERRHAECAAMLSGQRMQRVSGLREIVGWFFGRRRPAGGLASHRHNATFREALRRRMHARVGARACLRWLAGPALAEWRPSDGRGH